MVDELTQESFQTGKAIVTVSVDIIQAIADACRKSEEAKGNMTPEQKDNVLKKVVGLVTSNYKETHGSLKTFNKDGADVAHLDVSDERTAEIIKEVCKKSHIPVDLKETPRADGTCSYVAFCEVKSVDQLTAIIEMASKQVEEEQAAMTKEIVVYNDKDEPIVSVSFVKEEDIKYERFSEVQDKAVRFEVRDYEKNVLDKGDLIPGEDTKEKIKEKAVKHAIKPKKSLKERIKDKKELSEKKDKNRQREKVKQKTKNRSQSR